VLKLEGVIRHAGRFTLGPIDLEVAAGECFVLLGATGSGKSLTLGAVVGTGNVAGGAIILDGRDVTALPPEARPIGYVHQDGFLFPHMTVAGNIGFPLFRLSRAEKMQRIQETAEDLGIAHLLDRRITGLSGGEAQRVALGRALARRPPIILLDEPLGSLDPTTRRRLLGVLKEIKSRHRVTMLHVTHDFEEAAALGDRIGVMIAGKLAQTGPTDAVFRAPASEAVAEFIGIRNVIRGRIERDADGAALVTPGGARLVIPDAAAAGEAVYTVTADSVILSRAELDSSARNRLRGVVTEVTSGANLHHVTIDVGFFLEATVTRRSIEELEIAPGRALWVAIKSTALHRLSRE
jgi:molybdate/tungstate transport system ATP-binding protein